MFVSRLEQACKKDDAPGNISDKMAARSETERLTKAVSCSVLFEISELTCRQRSTAAARETNVGCVSMLLCVPEPQGGTIQAASGLARACPG